MSALIREHTARPALVSDRPPSVPVARPTVSSALKSPAPPTEPRRAEVVHLPDLPGIDCPCGVARRAFAEYDDFPGTVHLTRIDHAARTHYHRHHTEIYVVLECDPDAAIELDGTPHPVRPHTSILIPPGVRHRAVGRLTVLIVCSPEFDPEDEFFD
ncbi:cupin domain-containing protein [Crateriforma conspicua]|uniref:cupin domain-containing protein n=1 Tax=Crateriforma conspicua TaxID=2527996 RepID=UPI0036F2F62E